MKLLKSWEIEEDASEQMRWIRYSITGIVVAEVVYDMADQSWGWFAWVGDSDCGSVLAFKTDSLAKSACDTALRNNGYRFIKKNQLVML